eukprot:scaffold6597_cov202-Prasinococcus_capsulatus_cf.AAC.1
MPSHPGGSDARVPPRRRRACATDEASGHPMMRQAVARDSAQRCAQRSAALRPWARGPVPGTH